MSEDIQARARARIACKRDARHLSTLVSEFLATHGDQLREDERALFQRFQILVQRIGW